jgi:cytochrome bd ubiquinol oxidase subunit I
MDVEFLARFQFALTIMFHYIYPPFSIGLGLFMVMAEGAYMKTKNPEYLKMAKFWTKVFALTFAVGVATGIVMEFEFGTNWATYSRYVGDVFGSALAAEGIFAFFLESGFLALLLFGWNRISPKFHYFATIMVALGSHFSSVWIVVANSWMQTPAGFKIVGHGLTARAEITSFWAMVFNPSSMTRIGHVVVGCWLQGAFLILSICAYYIIKNKHVDFAKKSIKIALTIACVAIVLQTFLGDRSGKIVAKYQPAKLAAFESLFKTQDGAPLTIFGIPDVENGTVNYQIAIPKLLSFLSFRDFNAQVQGLEAFPKEDRPNTAVLFNVYRIMIAMWAIMLTICIIGVWKWRKGTLFETSWFMRILNFSVIVPLLANQAGWVSAEMGRQPWIVQGLLRTSEGLSKTVTANMVLSSIIMFGTVYLFLLLMFLYLLTKKIHHGPEEKEEEQTPYHHLAEYIEEISHD